MLCEAFTQMQHKVVQVSIRTVLSLLKKYANWGALDQGTHIHSQIIESGFEVNVCVRSALVHMYAKCGKIESARAVFDKFCDRDVVLWTAMITGYAQHGLAGDALTLFKQMQEEGENPNNFTLASALKACTSLANLRWGKQVHAGIIRGSFESDVFLINALTDMYAKCGRIEDAHTMFDKMHRQDVVSWSSMISGCTLHGLETEALTLFEQMQRQGLNPNKYTFVGILKACANLKALEQGKEIHCYSTESGQEDDVFVRSAIVDMYVKCGSTEDARQMLDKMQEPDMVSCNAMISGYAQEGPQKEALNLYSEMQQQGIVADEVTYACILRACASLVLLEQGKQIHARIVRKGLELEVVLGSILIDMYAKCGRLEYAHQVFKGVNKKDVVLWNSLIGGYAKQGYGEEALKFFNQMQHEGTIADDVTFLIILKACTSLAALNFGMQIHDHLMESSIETKMIVISSSLVDMYAKCGSIEDARQLFNHMKERDVAAWNTIILGYAQQGLSKEAVTLFETMQNKGLKPNEVTLGCVLFACRHDGLVQDGCHYFEAAIQDHGVTLTRQHYSSIVDLFSRAGQLSDAVDFLNNLPVEPSIESWIALLGACRIHGNIEIGQNAFECINHSDPGNVESSVTLSNIYASTGRWDLVEMIKQKLEDAVMDRELECSLIDIWN